MGRHGVYVVKGEDQVVFVHFTAGNFSPDDSAKNTILHDFLPSFKGLAVFSSFLKPENPTVYAPAA